MDEFTCPRCGEKEQLRGEAIDGDETRRRIHCEACEASWVRDLHVCPECDSHNVFDERRPLYQKARGVQQSIISMFTVQVCADCGWTNAAGDARRGWTSDDR